MFSRGRKETKLHQIWKQLFIGGELFLVENEMWDSDELPLFGVPSSLSRLSNKASASCASLLWTLCHSTTQGALPFRFWGDFHTLLIHTPALATSLSSRWHTLLLSEETTLVTVGHVNIIILLKYVGIMTFDKCSYIFTTWRLIRILSRCWSYCWDTFSRAAAAAGVTADPPAFQQGTEGPRLILWRGTTQTLGAAESVNPTCFSNGQSGGI